jgi:PAS domain S-box-containing protein
MKKKGGKAKGFFIKLLRISGWRIGAEAKSKNNSTNNDTVSVKRTKRPASGKAVLQGRLVTKGFMLAFLFMVVILAGLVWYTWRSNFHLKALETKHFRLLDLSGQIVYFDEVLTMSTEMAAHTGEMAWEARYRNYEPQLDAAIKEVLELSPEKFMKEAISRTDAANVKLVALENRAFDLVRQGDREQASSLLHSLEYMKQKQVYSNGIKEISNAIGSLEEARLKKEQGIALTVTVLLIVTIPLVGYIWFTSLGILRRYIFERKRSELALRMSEQRFKAIADYSYFWEVWVSPGGNPVWTNPAVEQVTGYSAEELMAMRDYPGALVCEEDREKVEDAFKSALEGGNGKEMEFRLLRKDGSVIWAETAWQPIFDDKGVSQGHRVSIHDITERKQAEEASKVSETNYRSIFNSVDDAIYVHDIETGKILNVNEKASEMFGYTKQELLKLTVKDLCLDEHPYTLEEALRLIRKALEEGPQRFEWIVKHKNGQTFWVEISLRAAVIEGQSRMLAILRDITDRKEAEDALRESEMMNRSLLEGSPVCNKIVDLDFKLRYMSAAGIKRLKITDIKPYYGQTFPPAFYPESTRASLIKKLKAAMAGTIASVEAPVHDMEGDEVWYHTTFVPALDDDGRVKYVIATSVDITERKKAEDALRDSEERFRRISECAFEGIFMHDKGRIVDANNALAVMSGYELSELIGMDGLDLIAPEERELIAKNFQSEFDKPFEVLGLRKDGSTNPLEIQSKRISFKDQQVMVVAVRDITERKEAEQALLESEHRFRDFFENAPVGFHIFGPDQIIIDINEAELEMIGYSRDAIVGKKTWAELIVPQERDMFKKHWHAITTKGRVRDLEYTLVHKDGHHINVILNASARFDESGNIVNTRGSVLNITARKKAYNQLRQSEERYRALVENVGMGITLVDADHNIVMTNSTVGKMFDCDVTELVGEKCYNKFEKRQEVCTHCPGEVAMKTGQAEEVETEGVRDDGSRFTVRINAFPLFAENGKSTGFIEVVEDITERKKADEALRNSEQRYRSLVANIPGVVYRGTLDEHWTMHYMSELIEKVSGYPVSDFIENKVRSFASIIHPEDREMVSEIVFEQVNKGRSFSIEYRIITSDGNVEWMFERGRGIKDENGKVLYLDGVLFNVTDRKEALEALAESQESLAHAQRITHIGNWDWNVNQDSLLWSDEMFSIFGFAKDEFTASYDDFINIVHPKDREFVNEQVRSALKGRIPFDCQFRLLLKDGTLKDIEAKGKVFRDENGKPMRMIGTNQNITEHKQAERKIESLARFPAENPNPVFRISDDGTVLYNNKAGSELLDVSQCNDANRMLKHLHKYMSKALKLSEPLQSEITCCDKVYSLTFAPVAESNYVNVYGLEITARKRAEQARKRLSKELEIKNKDLESILYAASHDLKSPLVNIQGFSHELGQSCELVRSALAGVDQKVDTAKVMEIALNEDIPQALGYIMASSAKMDSLLSGLLDISRLDSIAISVKPIDVNAMMANVIEHIKYQITKAGVQLDIQTLPACVGDISQINRVFTNLLTNALKFLDKSRSGTIYISGESLNDDSVYCVADNGIGIAAEHQEKIFEIFYQLEPDKRKGDGLGLTIAKRITERHNGRIWVESEVGKGSKFFVTLPNV